MARNMGKMPVRAPPKTMTSYEFGFILEQSLGHATHAKNFLTNVACDNEVNARWGMIDF
jgi:hypothetical protein